MKVLLRIFGLKFVIGLCLMATFAYLLWDGVQANERAWAEHHQNVIENQQNAIKTKRIGYLIDEIKTIVTRDEATAAKSAENQMVLIDWVRSLTVNQRELVALLRANGIPVPIKFITVVPPVAQAVVSSSSKSGHTKHQPRK